MDFSRQAGDGILRNGPRKETEIHWAPKRDRDLRDGPKKANRGRKATGRTPKRGRRPTRHGKDQLAGWGRIPTGRARKGTETHGAPKTDGDLWDGPQNAGRGRRPTERTPDGWKGTETQETDPERGQRPTEGNPAGRHGALGAPGGEQYMCYVFWASGPTCKHLSAFWAFRRPKIIFSAFRAPGRSSSAHFCFGLGGLGADADIFS